MTDASTFAGEYVFGSLSSDITDNNIVRTFWVGFHRSSIRSPIKNTFDTNKSCYKRHLIHHLKSLLTKWIESSY